MNSSPTVTTDRQALEDFVVDNPDLEWLEALLDQFNIFEAVGVVRQELRHSDFLGFLLDPRQPHGLGDAFLKRFLQKALVAARGTHTLPISLIDLDVWNLGDTAVLREWSNIDLLLVSGDHRVVVVIENKVDSSEHSGQLARYLTIVGQHYPGYRVIPLFLTREGQMPSDERFVPVSYRSVISLLDDLMASRAATLGDDVRTLVRHYIQMVRRHIVNENEVVELCRRIYAKHQRALDLIYAHRPDRQAEIQAEMANLILQTPGMRLRYNTKSKLGFHPETWDTPVLQGDLGKQAPALLLEFYIDNTPTQVRVTLYINSGPEEYRKKLLDMAQRNKPPLKPAFAAPYTVNQIFTRTWVTAKQLQEAELPELAEALRKTWKHFVDHELAGIEKIVRGETWIWPAVGATPDE